MRQSLRFTGSFVAALALGASVLRAQEAPPPPEARRPGLTLYVYEVARGPAKLQPLVPGQTPNVSKYVDAFNLRTDDDFGNVKDPFVATAFGFLNVERAGTYAISLNTDDGGELLIDGGRIIDNDGLNDGTKPALGTIELSAGVHAIRVNMFDAGADQLIKVQWKPPGASDFVVVPSTSLFTQANVVHVTSPGKKQLIAPLADTRPGDGQPEEAVHPSFTVSDIHHDGFEPRIGGIDFMPDGRMVVCTWDAQGNVFVVDPKTHAAKKFATGLAEPLGIKVVDGQIYVLQKQELTLLLDHDGDGVADEYRCVSNAWPVTANFHEFAFGLIYKDGYFYANLAVAIDPGGRTHKPQITQDPTTGVGRGQCIRIDPKTGELKSIAQGLRAANGIGLMSNGDIYITDNQGDWLPSSKLIKIHEGAFYNEHTVPEQPWGTKPVSPPVVWLPQGEIGNSPSTPIECLVGPWKGQILNSDVTHGGIKRTFVETIQTPDGPVDQGCVFRFSQGFNAGINRLCWGPDGALYCGEIGVAGNWGQDGKAKFGLQRLEYNGKPTFEMLAVRAKTNGFDIEFTEPLADDAFADEPTHYALTQWRYEPVDTYGGPKVDQVDLAVKSVTISGDRKHAFLEVDGLQPAHVVYLRLADGIRAQNGEHLWSTEGWYTLNAIPRDQPGTVGTPREQNLLTDAEKSAGWTLLFDGHSLANWKGFQKDEPPKGWTVADGILSCANGDGDLTTIQEYGDFELSVDWRISRGGNSGIIWRVSEAESPSWHTGPEMQILDDKRHNDGKLAVTSAGACYALIAPPRDVSLAPDRWNTARIVARGTKVQYWLNGEQTASFDTASDAWNALVAKSKFSDLPNFAKMSKGHICLQFHGDPVSYRNVKVRKLDEFDR